MSDSKVLATVAGRDITEEQVDAYIMTLPKEQQAYAKNPKFRKQVLDQLVTISLFAELGKEEKLDETAEFEEILASAKRDILAQMAIQQVISQVTVTDEELKTYYEENRDKLKTEEAVSAKHILVDSEELCSEIKGRIDRGEISFEDAAKAHSTCPSGKDGGDLGAFGHGQMVPEFDRAAFDAEVGAVVGPVQTQFGWHLIRVYEKAEANTPALEEIREDLGKKLLAGKREKAYAARLKELGEKYVAK